MDTVDRNYNFNSKQLLYSTPDTIMNNFSFKRSVFTFSVLHEFAYREIDQKTCITTQ